MRYIAIFVTIAFSLLFCMLSCKEQKAQKKYNDLYGNWKIVDLKTDDSAADLAFVMMAVTGNFPEGIRIEKDSLKMLLRSKDTPSVEAVHYTRKEDTLLLHNNNTTEYTEIKYQGDTLILSGKGYQYYLLRQAETK